MKNISLFILSFLCLTVLQSQSGQAVLKEQVIVFTQKGDLHFLEMTLPKIKTYCQDKKIELIEKNAADGTPENIVSTPAIVYQNYRGRSFYSSRYAEFSTIQNFIRTSRVVPQTAILNSYKDVLVWKNGRTQIAGSLKITDLKGKIPNDVHEDDFKTKAAQALEKGMSQFDGQSSVALSKTDRLFYLDMHPYRNAAGEFFLSLELYSKFSCKTPIFSKMTESLKSDFADFEQLFEEAGAIFQKEITQQMNTSKIGDAFSAVAKNIPVVSWETLDLQLPEAPTMNTDFANVSTTLAKNWTFKSAVDEETPIVQFRFMAPLDRYVGEIRKITGELKLTDNQSIESGQFIADMQSLTMGMEDFDKNVLGKYIKAFRFPESSFTFSKFSEQYILKLGETTFFKVQGIFELMKKKRPVEVSAQGTSIIDADGEVALKVSAVFSLNVVDDFGIKGPDGPLPARKMMRFDLNFLMKNISK